MEKISRTRPHGLTHPLYRVSQIVTDKKQVFIAASSQPLARGTVNDLQGY